MTASIEDLKNLVINGQFEDLSTQLPEDDEERLQTLRDIEATLPRDKSILTLARDRNPVLIPIALSLYPESARLEVISQEARTMPGKVSYRPKKPWLYLLTEAYAKQPGLLTVIQAVLSALPDDERVKALTQASFYSYRCPLDIAVNHPELWALLNNTLHDDGLASAVLVREPSNASGNLLRRLAYSAGTSENAMIRAIHALPPELRLKAILQSGCSKNPIDLVLPPCPNIPRLHVMVKALPVNDRLLLASHYYHKDQRDFIPSELLSALTVGLSPSDCLRLLTTTIKRRPIASWQRSWGDTTILYELATCPTVLESTLNTLRAEPKSDVEQPQTEENLPPFLLPLNEIRSRISRSTTEEAKTTRRLFKLLSMTHSILLDSPQTVDRQTFATLALSAIDTVRPIAKSWYLGRENPWEPMLDKLAADITALASVTAGNSVFDEAPAGRPEAPQADAALAAAV